VVNFSAFILDHFSTFRVRDLTQKHHGHIRLLQDQLSEATYDRNGTDLQSRGLYLDLKPWQAQAFAMTLLA